MVMQATQPARPLRYSVATAARLLDVTPQTVRDLLRTKVLTPIESTGGMRPKSYLDPGEVAAYATGGLEGVVAYRKKHAKKK